MQQEREAFVVGGQKIQLILRNESLALSCYQLVRQL